jgi:hypothetical protein
MRWTLTRELFVRMLREEWRMHARLFGGKRYAAFPLVSFALSATAVWGLVAIGTESAQVLAGMHALALLFGFQTGMVGLIGGDAIGNRLGDVTLVLYSARTLPVSRVRLFAVFLVKDVVYYSALFLLPFSLAVLPLAADGPGIVATIPLLWASTTGTFLLGGTATMALIGASRHGVGGRVVAFGVAAVCGVAWQAGAVDAVAFTPYAWYASPSVASVLTGTAPVVVLGVVGLATYDLEGATRERTANGGLRSLARRLPVADSALVGKTLLDLRRSPGGVGKVLFSAAVIAATGLGIVAVVERLLGVAPSYPVVVGGMLGLTAFTTYNWLTLFDGADDYAALPVEPAAVYRAKFRAFVLVGLPTGLAFYVLSLVAAGRLSTGSPPQSGGGPLAGTVSTLFPGASAGSVLAGAVLVACLHLYLVGVTAVLTGLSPDEFLFDTVLFATFAAAVAVVLVPVLVVGIATASPSLPVLAGLLAWAGGAAVAGVWLYRRAVPTG